MLMLYSIITLTLSSFLLFLIEPLSAKALLPVFGGAPAVWNMCMVFFQGTLLLGYFYAFATTKFFSATSQRLIHFLLLAVSLLTLPILWKTIDLPTVNNPAFNVLWLLASKLTLPLFIVSTTAPLVQHWFSQTNNPHAKDPYFLYSASNIGSLVALLGFPFLLEPFIGLQHLSLAWSLGYCIFALVLLFIAYQTRQEQFAITINEAPIKTQINWQQRSMWLLLSFAPSSLLMAVTQYITTEIVAVPLLWVIPLAIYLITFIIVFSRNPIIKQDWMVREQPIFILFAIISLGKATLTLPAWQLLLFHLVGFFALVMVCHGELVKRRPDKSHLTEFYLWISLGGFLGGIFNSIIAPLIFNGIYEYYIAFCLCILLRPWQQTKSRWHLADVIVPLIIFAVLSAKYYIALHLPENFSITLAHTDIKIFQWSDLFIELTLITVILLWHKNPYRFAASLAILFFFGQTIPGFKHNDLIWQSRNFFGVTRVYKNDDLNLHVLMSGKTLHGVQFLDKSIEFNRQTAYYKPIQQVTELFTKEKTSLNIAIAGLGSGEIGCHFRQTDKVTFFEIDPTVIQIANTPQLFTYLHDCPPKGGVVLGDARLNLNTQTAHAFDVVIVDVYSADALPVHLFTYEAVQMYLQKLSANGLLIFNISSSHFDIYPVLTAIASRLNMTALGYYQPAADIGRLQLPSEWVILTANIVLAEKLSKELHWKKLAAKDDSYMWSDDYSNILKVLR